MIYSIRQIARESNMHYMQIIKLLAEFDWIIRFKNLELITNHEYLTYHKGQICFTEEGLIEFDFNLMKKFRGGK